MTATSAQMERIGVAAVDAAFSAVGWAFREQIVADHGIDAHAEVDGLTSVPTGRYLAVQIKCGPSFFKSSTANGWRFREDTKHLNYWLANLMPVILVLVDPQTKIGYWVQITHEAVHYTGKGWWIEVPKTQVLDESSHPALRDLALATMPALPDPVAQALPLLPPSAVQALSALDTVDRDGSLRLAKVLTEGRARPRETVEALLTASQSWPHATLLRLATIGAYANEHGHRDLAAAAFALASERAPATGDGVERLRLRGIAALMALSADDRDRAAELLGDARATAGASLLADVAVRAFDADEAGRDDALESLLGAIGDERLDAEPTCLLFLAERAFVHGDLHSSLELYERACRRHPSIIGGRLALARVLIERVLQGRSVMPHPDQQKALELATAVRDEIRRWSGPSETAHRTIVQQRMIAQAFAEVIHLATPVASGGAAFEREATDPVVATCGAQAGMALGNHALAARFADAMRGTPAEPMLRAITADPDLPRDQTITVWRELLATATTPSATRSCLLQLATRGALTADDLTRHTEDANLDDEDRTVFTARTIAGAGDLDTAIVMLQPLTSPAAREILAELLHAAGRSGEAVAVCDDLWRRTHTLKALQDKVNILAESGDLDGAEDCATVLLASRELPAEHRSLLHWRRIQRRAAQGDWDGVQTCCRDALQDQPGDDITWALICAQLNQDDWDAAWDTYRQLRPTVGDSALVRPWAELHARFGPVPRQQALAAELAARFAGDQEAAEHLARLSAAAP
ncbi:DUF4365 domain-containing protein [Actinoplanes derwentensis]|uniref:DUF4365 domain-containing protein n=1 Tax=Actinoplanes derwentensis TaxID=113562 RepID=A0A1H2DCI3_9ACTN|nr:DUF4365 domain-containing protein [Actinoplanes derwentensis]GID90414.1 hypothetical protein Ade03nite_93380 [Actinoplanes derwentensis]SDT80455.1 protein of unknown function [Actinoplanes derwentensis]